MMIFGILLRKNTQWERLIKILIVDFCLDNSTFAVKNRIRNSSEIRIIF